MSRPVQRLARPPPSRAMRRRPGGCAFAEDPRRPAPEARIVWDASLDPGTLRARACPTAAQDPDALDLDRLQPWLTLVADENGEHIALSDGWRRVRIDIEDGSLAVGTPIVLHYAIQGIESAAPKLLPLARLVDIVRNGRFSRSLFPSDTRIDRHILALRVHDALVAGASQREIADVLYGEASPELADSLRSRVRRLVREARRMASGGYRSLLKADPKPRRR